MKFISVLFLLAGCASHLYQTDPELVTYAERFRQDALNHGYYIVPTAMTLSDDDARISADLAGVCYSYEDGTRLIVLRKSNWGYLPNDTWKDALVYHEQGHCVFGLVHQPSGIMEATIDMFHMTYQSFDDYWNLVKSTR